MGIPTLISTCTATSDALCAFTSGIDSTYDEYMFVVTSFNPEGQSSLYIQASIDGGSNYNVACTSSTADAFIQEANYPPGTSFAYDTGQDKAQSTDLIVIEWSTSPDADACTAGILHLFNPASTVYAKQWYFRGVGNDGDSCTVPHCAGFFNTTSAINAFKFDADAADDFDGVFQMYGIS